jgi:glycosyltransferase involved in cell wall biosynthesis
VEDAIKMSRIMLVVDSLDVGGAERHVVDLAVALRERGHEVAVACSQGGVLGAELEATQIPVQVLMDQLVKRRVSLTYGMRLRDIVCRDRFDLVHAHLYASAAASVIATLGARARPLVVTEHSPACWQDPMARRTSWWVARRAALVIAVSSSIRSQVVERGGAPADRVLTIPNGIRPARAGAPVAVPRQGPIIGVVARLQPEKGVDLFLKAAACIGQAIPACRFVVVGDGPLREPLERRAHALELDGRVQFLGWRRDARDIIARLDVLMVPSRSEGAPLVTLEAMAAGVPVVAAATGGVAEQIGSGGTIVPPEDHPALADACMMLLRNPRHARRMGTAGMARAEKLYNHASMVDRVEDAYSRVTTRVI